jgi:hypothetical protein
MIPLASRHKEDRLSRINLESESNHQMLDNFHDSLCTGLVSQIDSLNFNLCMLYIHTYVCMHILVS